MIEQRRKQEKKEEKRRMTKIDSLKVDLNVNPADERIKKIHTFAKQRKVKVQRRTKIKDVKEKIVSVAANEFAFGEFKKNGREILKVN